MKEQAAKLAGLDGAKGVRYVVRGPRSEKVRQARGVLQWNAVQVFWRYNGRPGERIAGDFLGPVQPETKRTVAQVKALGDMHGIYSSYGGSHDETARAWHDAQEGDSQ